MLRGQVINLPKQSDEDSANRGNLSVNASAVNTDPLAGGACGALSICEPSRSYYVTKRLFDILLSLLGIVFLFPVFACIALCIKLDDGGPVLHFREIVGKHGKRFYALKFR